MKQHISPHFDDRPANTPIDMLVLHYTGMRSGKTALEHLLHPASKVSAHYLVEEDGTVYAMVPEAKRAWHAGKSYWRGKSGVNACSIGIEIVNPGHEFGYRPFPERQIEAVIELCQGILQRHPIPPHHVVAHSDIAPLRKEDPGELFPWKTLAENGIGLWVESPATPITPIASLGDQGEVVRQLQTQLQGFGYSIAITGHYTLETALVAKAFKQHFCQEKIANGAWDSHAAQVLERLVSEAGQIIKKP